VSASAASDHWRGLDPLLNRALSLAGVEVVHRRAELVGEVPGLIKAVGREAVAAAAADLLGQRRAVVELLAAARS
jgi:tRNA A37 threonylcarbamoyltransferase TsaD